MGINHENRKSLLSGLAVFYAPPTIHRSNGYGGPEQTEAAVEADKQREQTEKGRKRPRHSLNRGER